MSGVSDPWKHLRDGREGKTLAEFEVPQKIKIRTIAGELEIENVVKVVQLPHEYDDLQQRSKSKT